MNYKIILKIEGNSESAKNHLSHLKGIEIREFEAMEIDYISVVQEISLDYLTQQLPDNFFDLVNSDQINFIENHLAEVYEDYTGEYIKEQILDYSRGRTFSYQKKGFLVKDKIAN